jgi:hypothetical protein
MFEVTSSTGRIPSDQNAAIEYSDVLSHPEVTIGKAGGVAA